MRVLLVLGALLAVVLLAAALLLPRWLAGDDARERLLSAARDATGRDVAVDDLTLALFPPRLVASGVRVGDAAAPLVTARDVDLRVRLGPLFAGALVVESLSLEGVVWRISRTAGGIELPIPAPDAKAAVAPAAAASGAPADASGSLRFAAERIGLRDSQIVWDDAVATPPVRIEVNDVVGEARGVDPAEPLVFDLAGTLAGGGTLRVASGPGGDAPDLEATLTGVDLAPFAPYLGKDLALGGRVDGTIRARGRAESLEALEADLQIADAKVRAGDVVAEGPVGVQARLAGALSALTGSFSLDATAATLDAYGGVFRKPPGAPATATGRLVRDANGKLSVDGVRVQIKNMDGKLDATPGAWRFEAQPFDLGAFLGAKHGPLALAGALVGGGGALRSENLVATVGGQPVAIAVHAAGLDAQPHHHVTIAAQAVDANALLTALTGEADAIEGPLTLRADLAGPLGANAVAALAGEADLAVGAGRLPGVSPLRAALDGLAKYRQAADVLDPARAQQSLAPYLGDRFESITGRFAIGEGRARTDALVLTYPGYRLELRGKIGLADQSLDAKGRVVLEPALEAALANRPVDAGGDGRQIEVAKVRGTLSDPKLEIDQAGAIAFAASLALAQKRDKWERKLDEALGDGSGGALLDALDGILGKKQRN
jgi:hypothetical protein